MVLTVGLLKVLLYIRSIVVVLLRSLRQLLYLYCLPIELAVHRPVYELAVIEDATRALLESRVIES